MDELIAFLHTCIDEDGQVARGGDERSPDMTLRLDDDLRWVSVTPARVLAEVESKRRIMEEHAPEDGHCSTCTIEDMDENASADYDSEPEMIRVRRPVAWPCPTVRLLAELYADRPGYKESWRP